MKFYQALQARVTSQKQQSPGLPSDCELLTWFRPDQPNLNQSQISR